MFYIFFWEYGCVNSQFIHYSVKPMHGEAFEFTFIYEFNDQASREELWSNLKRMSRESDKPWLLMGDFNAHSSVEHKISSIVRQSETAPMVESLAFCNLMDVKAIDKHFTWNNK